MLVVRVGSLHRLGLHRQIVVGRHRAGIDERFDGIVQAIVGVRSSDTAADCGAAVAGRARQRHRDAACIGNCF